LLFLKENSGEPVRNVEKTGLSETSTMFQILVSFSNAVKSVDFAHVGENDGALVLQA
jgi:hypothetical protein